MLKVEPSLSWPEMELVRDVMPVLVTCKFDEDPIKNEGTIVSTTFFQVSRASNSEVIGQILPEFGLIQDFMLVLVTCKYDGDLIKYEGTILSTTLSPL